MENSFDAIIVGAGQAGPALAARLTSAGKSVALIERSELGGTCVNSGCTPTKTLIASAYAAHLCRQAEAYGVRPGGKPVVDMQRVKARKDAVVEQFRHGLTTWLGNMPNCLVYHGHARLESAHAVRVGGQLVQAEHIFLNVGARPLVPDMPGARDTPFMTTSTIMDVDYLPNHLLIIGGSYVGIEFAQMYRRFGSEVTIVERDDRLIAREDKDVSAAILAVLEDEGVQVRLNAECITLRRTAGGVGALLSCDEGPDNVAGSHLLLAIGRQPNTDDLDADKAGVALDKRGYVQVDERLRTSQPSIFALGDCNGRGAFTHTAYNDYEIVADNLLDGAARSVNQRQVAYALYTDPPLGRVGMTEAQALQSGRRVLIGRRLMTRVGRAIEKGETRGFMKVLVDAQTRELLGASILGVGGDEAIHSLLFAMQGHMTADACRQAVPIHPTVSELIPTLLGDLQPLAAGAVAVDPQNVAS